MLLFIFSTYYIPKMQAMHITSSMVLHQHPSFPNTFSVSPVQSPSNKSQYSLHDNHGFFFLKKKSKIIQHTSGNIVVRWFSQSFRVGYSPGIGPSFPARKSCMHANYYHHTHRHINKLHIHIHNTYIICFSNLLFRLPWRTIQHSRYTCACDTQNT